MLNIVILMRLIMILAVWNLPWLIVCNFGVLCMLSGLYSDINCWTDYVWTWSINWDMIWMYMIHASRTVYDAVTAETKRYNLLFQADLTARPQPGAAATGPCPGLPPRTPPGGCRPRTPTRGAGSPEPSLYIFCALNCLFEHGAGYGLKTLRLIVYGFGFINTTCMSFSSFL